MHAAVRTFFGRIADSLGAIVLSLVAVVQESGVGPTGIKMTGK